MKDASATLAITAFAALACASAVSRAETEVSPVEDSPVRSFFLVDQLEHTSSRFTDGKGSDALRFNALGWVGGDYNRLWINAEGRKPTDGRLEDFDVQVLYGRLIAPFWDLQVGLRHARPLADGPTRGSAVLGVQGLAPYRYEVQAAAFVSDRGEVSARAELEYELLLTQRWILQPRFATNIAIQGVPAQGIGSGVNDVELGLRLRYEIVREFAPYVGVSWQSRYGDSARYARDRAEVDGEWRLVAGIRMWF